MPVIRLKRGTTEPTAANLVTGELAINTSDGSVYTLTDAGDVVSIKGSSATSLTATVRNQTGATLTKGTVVYITGASGNKPLVSKSQANAESTSARTYGILQADIPTNQNGTAVLAGLLSGIDTSSYAEGTQLYLSPTVAGGITTTKPSAPNHLVYLGVISRSHANQGQIEVHISNGFELEELHNVSITSVANNNLLAYESSTSLWKNKSITQLGIAPLTSPSFLGQPTTTTASVQTGGSFIANTAYVYNAIQSYSRPPSSQYITGLVTGSSISPFTNGVYLLEADEENAVVTILTSNIFNNGGSCTLIQVGSNSIVFDPFNIAARYDGKRRTAGEHAVVHIKNSGGALYISGDLIEPPFPPAGTLLSAGCVEATTTDASNVEWTGNYLYREVFADGAGGSYNNDVYDSSGCYYPYGYVLSSNTGDLTFEWTHGEDSGTFVYGYGTTTVYSNGSGGTLGGSENTITATDNQIVHSYEGVNGDGYPVNNVLYFRLSDNTLQEAEWIVAGTMVGESCVEWTENDANLISHTWNVLATSYADGTGGTYSQLSKNTDTCGYYPSGYYLSYGQTLLTLYYPDENGNNQPFDYGYNVQYTIADGAGGEFSGVDGPIYYYGIGYNFYSYYDSAGQQTVTYHWDGNDSYYLSYS